ncbi:MAG: hypothetical protein WCW14_03530 [Candidatus Paceibacterota bacterium]|jgi:hypothetical protein
MERKNVSTVEPLTRDQIVPGLKLFGPIIPASKDPPMEKRRRGVYAAPQDMFTDVASLAAIASWKHSDYRLIWIGNHLDDCLEVRAVDGDFALVHGCPAYSHPVPVNDLWWVHVSDILKNEFFADRRKGLPMSEARATELLDRRSVDVCFRAGEDVRAVMIGAVSRMFSSPDEVGSKGSRDSARK